MMPLKNKREKVFYNIFSKTSHFSRTIYYGSYYFVLYIEPGKCKINRSK